MEYIKMLWKDLQQLQHDLVGLHVSEEPLLVGTVP